jgi:hypothetical protein
MGLPELLATMMAGYAVPDAETLPFMYFVMMQ